jgi:Ricin-type beta-trefoil lectin domain
MRSSLHPIRVIRVWLIAIALCPMAVSAQSTQTVRSILGRGVSPAELRVGDLLPPGKTISADANTVVALKREWNFKGGKCAVWVILRGSTLVVEKHTDSENCNPSGDGNVLQQAIDGRSMLASYTVRAIFSSPGNADTSLPKEFTRLDDELSAANANPQSLRPSSPTAVQLSSRSSLAHARNSMGQCLHRKFDNWQNGNPIHLWQCDAGAPNMKTWVFESNTGYIRSAADPSKCWHKDRLDWTNGNPIHLWNCNEGGPEQKTWTYEAQTGLIRSRANRSMCIHKREDGFRNGNPVHLSRCDAVRPEFKSWSLQ